MWNEPFEHLRRRLTFVYMMIFGVIILLIVATAYSFIWFEIISHEKKELVAQVYHEAEEWLASGENLARLLLCVMAVCWLILSLRTEKQLF